MEGEREGRMESEVEEATVWIEASRETIEEKFR
jgi:hypothetical protein